MKLVYIAGPFRAPTQYRVHLNIASAETDSLFVAGDGMVPVCPHTMYANFNGSLSDQFWLEATQEILKRCDAVWLCDGWRESAETLAEIETAKQQGIPVFSRYMDLLSWKEGAEE